MPLSRNGQSLRPNVSFLQDSSLWHRFTDESALVRIAADAKDVTEELDRAAKVVSGNEGNSIQKKRCVKRLCFVVHVVIASCVLSLGPVGFAQESIDQSRQPQSVAQPEQHRHIPVFGNADEFALSGDVEYYAPLDGFNRQNRDIDLQVVPIGLGAHMPHGWEFQFDGLALRAHGYRTLPSGAPSPQIPSSAQALGAGPLARWNFLQFSGFRSFVEAEGDFVLFNRPWPTYGTINDFLLRAGGGVAVRVSSSYWIESTFHWAHISNGECFCQGNPAWNGRGLSLGLRRTFGHERESHNKPGRWPFPNTDENAWITSLEDYTPAPGLNRQNSKVGADMRQLRISRAWHFPDHLEFQLGGMVQSTDTVVGFGPVLRWNCLERKHWRVFTDGGVDLLMTGSTAYVIPGKDVGYNFFPRGRVGATFRLHRSYWLETNFGWAHVTTGFGGHRQLLPWSGQGASVSLRRTFTGRVLHDQISRRRE